MPSRQSIPALPEARTAGGRGRDRIWTGLGSALDAAMMRGVRIVVERALIPTKDDVEALKSSAHHVLDQTLVAEPARFFDFVESPVLPRRVEIRSRRKITGGVALRCSLETDYRPYRSDGQPLGCSVSNGDAILLEHWQHDGAGKRGTVIGLHGFAMGRPAIDSVALFARQWFERGLDVVLMTLPHHGERKPTGARISGECFAVPHVARLSEAVREATFEIFVVKNWLRDTTDAPVGLLGLSLGGYLTSLAVGLSDDFDFAIPMVPPACIGDLAWRVFRGTSHGHAEGPPSVDQDELRASFRVHSPLAHELKIPKERVLIVAGRGDRVVPPEHPTALWQHWGEPPIHWFSGSHLAPFGRARVVDAIAAHLASLSILE